MSSSLSSSSSSSISTVDVYDQFISALHLSPPTVLEIDILPSTYPPQILYEHPALALPKPLLAKLFLHARAILFDGSPRHLEDDDDTYDARLKATSVILLFDPNHVTAANFRKRHVLRSFDNVEVHDDETGTNNEVAKRQYALIRTELILLTSLLTSPLPKHAKASTLWAHRLWIFRNYHESILIDAGRRTSESEGMRILWNEELGVVMKAGERHPSNYHAWQYARDLSCLLQLWLDERSSSSLMEECQSIWFESLAKVHAWCLMHPRDISGWSFLVFWLQWLKNVVIRGSGARWNHSSNEEEIDRVVQETKEWVHTYSWGGESVKWFLRSVTQAPIK